MAAYVVSDVSREVGLGAGFLAPAALTALLSEMLKRTQPVGYR